MKERSLLDDLFADDGIKEDKMTERSEGRNAEKGRIIDGWNPIRLNELDDS